MLRSKNDESICSSFGSSLSHQEPHESSEDNGSKSSDDASSKRSS